MQTTSLRGNTYNFLLTDDYSRYCWAFFLQRKSEALDCLNAFKQLQEKQVGLPLNALHTNKGGEFTSKEFVDYCEEHGIHQQLTAPYSPQQNVVAKRKNRMVIEMARTMLHEMKLPISLWAEAVASVIYLLNRSPTSALKHQTPYEALNGRKASVEHL